MFKYRSADTTPIQVTEALRQAVGGHALVAEMLARRGLLTPQAAQAFLDPACYIPSPPSDLPDLPAAVHGLEQALADGGCIGVWGDFDVDGQTATALLVSALQHIAALVRPAQPAQVVYYIPDRLTESHGIRLPALERFLAQGVQVLLTCDTGIEAHQAIDHARQRGVRVLVSDHHDLPDHLPQAEALVNPKRLPPEHPLRDLPGVGVAYQIVKALYEHAASQHPLGESPDQRYLDLVALGIVADVAEQKADTRYLLQRGLARLRQTQRAGLQALFETARIDPTYLSAEHIGFGLGPRLNALGRLSNAHLAVELLTTDDLGRARILAAQLEGLNNQRKLLSEQIYAAAQDQIARDPTLLDASALVLAHPHWHGGIVGPVAGRLAEQYARPVVLIVLGEDGVGRGSARSVTGCDIHAALKLADQHLLSYGGHPGAAGLSIRAEQVTAFRRALSRAVDTVWDRTLSPEANQVDASIGLGELSLELAIELERLAPFGQGNPPVRLASCNLSLADQRTFGRNGEHRQVVVQDKAGKTCSLVWWRGGEFELPAGRFDLAYWIKSTDYRGRRSLEIEWSEARLLETPSVTVEAGPAWEILDWRGEADLRARVAALAAGGDVQVWIEGPDSSGLPGRRRHELAAAASLVVWSCPPGPRELQAALARVSPSRVIVCGEADPRASLDALAPFLHRLAGLLNYDLSHRGGQVHLPALAAATGQRLVTVRKGLAWLAARGQIALSGWQGDQVQVVSAQADQGGPSGEAAHGGGDDTERRQLEADLHSLLAETAAYRAYFRRADVAGLLQ